MVKLDPLRPLRPSTEGPPKFPPDEAYTKRKNVRTACATCKKRKLKCSGIVPCENCNKIGAICTIDEDSDQRRKRVLKRKLEILEDKGTLLDQLVLTLQNSDRTVAAQVVNLIRSHATLDEIRAYIDDILERPKLEKTPELIEVCSGVQKWHDTQKRARADRPRVDHRELSDIVLFHVPARPWTNVTEDDEFVSHLMSLWFTWSHPFLNWIDRDLFIESMQSGDLDSPYCSPFLVNIILADACAYSDYPAAYAVASEQWSRGLHFYKEAKQHLDQENGKVTLASVEGLGVLYVVTCLMGNDRLGWVYLGQLAYAVQELAQKRRRPPVNADKDSLRYATAIDHAIWGIFHLASVTALSYQKGGLIKIPWAPFPTVDGDVHGQTWTNYPVSSKTTKSHEQCLFKAVCDVSLVTYDLTWSLFGNGDKELMLDANSVQAAEEAYARLQKWYEELPDCLGTSNATPHVLSLHLKYHTIIQTIFGFLKDLPNDEESEESTEWVQKTRRQARELCVGSAQANGRLIDIHRDLWNLEQMPPVTVHWVTVSMFTLLEYLDEEKSRDAFVSLSVAAKAFSHRWSLGKGMFRLFQVTSKQMEIKLPPETDALFTEFEYNWSPEDRKVLTSQYPNFANSVKRGQVDEIELDMFLAKFDDLHLAQDRDTSTGESFDGFEEMDGLWQKEGSGS